MLKKLSVLGELFHRRVLEHVDQPEHDRSLHLRHARRAEERLRAKVVKLPSSHSPSKRPNFHTKLAKISGDFLDYFEIFHNFWKKRYYVLSIILVTLMSPMMRWTHDQGLKIPYVKIFNNRIWDVVAGLEPFTISFLVPDDDGLLGHWQVSFSIYRFIILFAFLLLTGVGSWMFHMTLLYEMQLMDEIPMVWGSAYMVFCLYQVSIVTSPLILILKAIFSSMWQNLAKFLHFGKEYLVFLWFLVFGTILNLFCYWTKLAKNWNNNLAWSRLSRIVRLKVVAS